MEVCQSTIPHATKDMRMKHKHIWVRSPSSATFSDTHVFWVETCECGAARKPQRKLPRRAPYAAKAPRARLKPMSDSKQAFTKLYAAMKKAMPDGQVCAVCGKTLHKEQVSWHHPRGRSGARMLVFVPTCLNCHTFIHGNPKLAKEKGWLQPELDGRKPDEFTQNPFHLPPE
jgi:hypothetical protein